MKFVVNKSSEKIFKQGLRSFFEYSDLGIDLATNGDCWANIIKAVAGKHPIGQWHSHAVNFQMVYIIEGWVKFEYEKEGVFRWANKWAISLSRFLRQFQNSII